MTEYACQICDWEDGETISALRAHVAAKKDEAHQEARREKAWTDWTENTQPTKEVEAGSEGGSEGGSDHSDEVDDEEPAPTTSETTEGEGVSTTSDQGGSDHSEGGSGGPDPSEEYEDQWTADSNQVEEGSEAGSDHSEGGSDSSDSKDNGIGAGAALVAGSVFVGLIVLLTRPEDGEEPIEVESEVEDVETSDGGGFSTVEGGSTSGSEGVSWE